ncbi:MAG TPA: beta-propeller domain-containing protein [Propionibacteriaceae bacterium]|nr:beta-propeller domain-containing protein [Propionibacteriaceae bacterium]
MSDFESRARKAADAVRHQIAESTHQPDKGIRRAQRSPARVAIPSAVAAVALIAGVMVGVPRIGNDPRQSVSGEGAAFALPGPLKPFDSCDAVLQYFKDQAPEYLIERAGGNAKAQTTSADTTAAQPGRTTDSAGTGAESGGAAPAHSTTNVQEAGVDEPDIVKTDGNRIVAVAQGRVHLIALDGGKMTLRKTLPDTNVRNVFLSGERVLVFGGQPAGGARPGLGWAGQQAVLAMYDISSLSEPKPIAGLTIDGDVLDARLVGTQVRVVTVSSPDVDAPSPVYGPDGGITQKSKDDLRAAVENTDVDDWIPTYTLQDRAGAEVSTGRLVECADLARPETFSGLDTVAVSSFDIGSALQTRNTVGVIAGGQQIYASGTSTYVSTTDWSRDGSTARTSLHKFVTASSGASTYQGSGEVPGTLLNQYAMSEYEGVLRVASTISERRGWANPRPMTEGVVTTLHEQDGALRQLGQVGGLGREDNESIRAVRFIEQRGYVVTFRQTDPLYVLDLRNAAAPKVVGELKIPGYSGYLHPIGENLLLGVGQSGLEPGPGTTGVTPRPPTEDGDTADGRDIAPSRGGQIGVQFSLFDISDPASPRRIDMQTYGGGAAAAEFDPKAFLYWEPRNLIIAPTNLHGDYRGKGAFSGLVLLRAGTGGLSELGRLATTQAYGAVNRSLVIGDTVYMLSDRALQANSLDTHREIDSLILQ